MLNNLLTLEILSVAFNLIFIILLTKEKRICWLFGILGSISGAILFYHQSYFSETILYSFYAILGVYAWVLWNQKSDSLLIKKLKGFWHVVIIVVGILLSWMLGRLMTTLNADKPYFDAFSTVFGVFATFLEMYKFLSGWLYWIGLNLFTIWLYSAKELWVYAGLMAVYTVLSVLGYMQWSRKIQAQ